MTTSLNLLELETDQSIENKVVLC